MKLNFEQQEKVTKLQFQAKSDQQEIKQTEMSQKQHKKRNSNNRDIKI